MEEWKGRGLGKGNKVYYENNLQNLPHGYPRFHRSLEEDKLHPKQQTSGVDLLLGDDGVGSTRTSYMESGALRLEKLDEKVRQWHQAMLEATQDKLFQRDARWTQRSGNLVEGDIVWLIKESKIQRKLKWGLVVSVCKDEEGICRD